MAVLIFSTPFITLAQQKSVEVQAKMAAERDAKTDVNRLLWTCIGCLSIYLSIGVGAYFAIEESDSWLLGFSISEESILRGVCVGGLFCGAFSWGAISYPSYPPSERLLGKSPEYVDFYTDAYKAKTKRLRAKWAAVGAAPLAVLLLMAAGEIATNGSSN